MWHTGDVPNKVPPMKFLVNFDFCKAHDNHYWKAKAVMDALMKTCLKINAFKERKRIGDMPYMDRFAALERSLRVLVSEYNERERLAKGVNYKEYKPKKLVSLAFTTVYNLIPSTKRARDKKKE